MTEDAFIVLTSNAFAILGLRAMCFLLAGMMARFVVGLSNVLALVGIKILASQLVEVPVWAPCRRSSRSSGSPCGRRSGPRGPQAERQEMPEREEVPSQTVT